MMTIYVAMAELEDGNRAIERAYMNKETAEQASKDMVKELEEKMQWQNMTPIVEEIELVFDN
jgi:hypothetical protein